ncbi:hypothetical protein [Streptomyces sp. NBC_01455]|uniref:hypothetical protein n=1 Tax=Streptomyces sp. NBC_01455 TaxID=2903874 RepID=UPI002E319DB7|nr:hypothetical protein [Streptomyces sp. NBC_01455]
MAQQDSQDHDAQIIALLMREYESLRAEIAQRVASRMQILGFSGVIAAIVVGAGGSSHRLYVAVFTVALGVLWLRDCNHGIQRIGKHLRDVEEEVNRLATRAYGSSALSWETKRHVGRQHEQPGWRLLGRLGGWTGRH